MRPQRPIAVVDLDGVLTDVRHRLHFVETTPKDWAGFFAAIPADAPFEVGLALVAELTPGHEIVYLTGRPEHTREATATWLSDHGFPKSRLVMRRDGDRRPARLAKPDQLRRLQGSATVAVVVDDDPAVCAALRSAGWPVLQADWMPLAELNREQECGRT